MSVGSAEIAVIAIGIYALAAFIGCGMYLAKTKPESVKWPSWLKFTPTKDLLRQAIAAEITIHIMPDLTRKVYSTKLNTLPPPAIAKVIENIVASGMDLGNQHGIQMHICTRPEHQEGNK